MAHYKRKKCRLHCPRAIRGSEAAWRAQHGVKPVRPKNPGSLRQRLDLPWPVDGRNMMNSWPRWWDKVFHTRPRRARVRALEQKVLKGADPDGLVWPDHNHKPHIYYW